jgi:ABC-type transport system substrate-binding protein
LKNAGVKPSLLLVTLSLLLIVGISAPVLAQPELRPVVINIQGAASTSDPFAHSNVNDRQWQGNVFESLFSYNGLTGEYEPRVGKTYEISDDGLEYTITIFDNIYFHNGEHCTAEDVKFSLEYAKASPFNTLYSGSIEKVDVIDEYTVRITLEAPNAAFLHNNDRIFIINKTVVEEQGKEFGAKANLAGTGAFYIEHYDPAVEIRLKKFDKYYRETGNIPGITFKILTDPAATLMAFEAGEIDFICEPPTSEFARLEASGKFTTYLGQTSQLCTLYINYDRNEPLRNKLVRQAIAYAIDYESVLIGAREGMGDINGKIMYAPWTIAAPEGGIIYSYQPEKAIELLNEAGYPDGVDIGPILAIAGIFHEKVAEIVQAFLDDVGIKTSVQTMEQVTCISEMRAGNYGIGVMGMYQMLDYDYAAVSHDPALDATTMAKIKGAADVDWERVEELFRLGRSVTEEAERRTYYSELDDILMDSGTVIPLWHNQLPYAWNKNLEINTQKSYTYQWTHLWDANWK